MKQWVLTPEEMRTVEKSAIGAGYPSLLLMEHAAGSVTDEVQSLIGGTCTGKKVLFLCGTGNNGGDGLAAARIFRDRGGISTVLLAGEPKTEDACTNYALLRMQESDIRYFGEGDIPDIGQFDAVVDAILGTGFHGIPDDTVSGMIALLEDADIPVIAVDVPSGLNALTGEAPGACVNASVTVTFHAAKRGLYLTENREAVGKMRVADIGLNYLDEEICPPRRESFVVTPDELRYLPSRRLRSHKGDMGRVLIYAGSMGMAGAAAMCAKACIKAGAGLVTLACEKELIPVLQTLVPGAMCRDIEDAVWNVPDYDVFCVGCGLGRGEKQWSNILALWDREKPSVWDADALNMLSQHRMRLGDMAVIMPHIGEAARLLNTTSDQVLADRFTAAGELGSKYDCTVILKSDVTLVHGFDGTAFIPWGTPALAKGGSGDVLCGMVAALQAQGECDAPVLAALWHALAARIGEEQFGMREMMAEELISCLNEAEKRYGA